MRSTNPFVDVGDGGEGDAGENGHLGHGTARDQYLSSMSLSSMFASSPVFPVWLSGWMAPAPDEDDASVFYDCRSSGDAGADPSPTPSVEDDATGLLTITVPDHGSAPLPPVASPLAQALATWLSPYADAAKRAGRRVLYFSDERAEARADETTVLLDECEAKADVTNTVRFRGDCESAGREENARSEGRASALHRVSSSPALMTVASDDILNDVAESDGASGRRSRRHNYGAVVLEDIAPGGSNDVKDGLVIYPWTKLILLEELGTALSWFVLLLPYACFLVAAVLDTTVKHAIVGPLLGNTTCAAIVKVNRGAVPTPFEVSVKGYFPVPFPVSFGLPPAAADARRPKGAALPSRAFPGSCTYPFELREGVGLLSHGKLSSLTSSPMSDKASIIDARYRYLMSHGHAFTSGVISNVPPTAQSLGMRAKFRNLSSDAVALVARGSVLVSAIVFQRRTPPREPATNGTDAKDNRTDFAETNPAFEQWSPVLILSAKRLDLVCEWNARGGNAASTWNCDGKRRVDVFFSLPNTAVLIGEDLRVDILFSHSKVYKSLTEDLWIHERGGTMGADDDYVLRDFRDNFVPSAADKILSAANTSHPRALLEELATKSQYEIEHESTAYNNVVETTRILALTITTAFLCYWLWGMRIMGGELQLFCKRSTQSTCRFWWEDPFSTFPERRYLLLLLCCLVLLQNPFLVYAFFRPSLYGSAKFRFAADSLSGISIHGILFLWLCLVHGLRYHTADIAGRRLSQHRRVIELRTSLSRRTSPRSAVEGDRWGQVRLYYQQYGDIDGSSDSMALRLKHDVNSDSFVEFIFPKITLLVIGVASTMTAAASRYPMSESTATSERVELNPDRFGSSSAVFVSSSLVQLIVIQIWCIFIVYTNFVTGERLRREPFLSTRPSQLAFRVLSANLFIFILFSISLFCLRSLNSFSDSEESDKGLSGHVVSYDTSRGGSDDGSWDSKADILFGIIRRATTELPYVGTASSTGPGQIFYATACSLVVAYIYLPSSHFNPSEKEQRIVDETTTDKKLQGTDKRFVVALARSTHTWRVFPLPTRNHGLLSQHTLKEKLRIIGTFQLEWFKRASVEPERDIFKNCKQRFGRGSIYKGRYIPVFCVEIACWLLEASWQAYYSPSEYLLNNWAPGRMRLDSIGLKLEHVITDPETDTHGFVASNVSEQAEGEEDSIIVIAFRGSASKTNVKTDLSFRQVPLPAKIMSDVPAFKIRPFAVEEVLPGTTKSSPRSNPHVDRLDLDQSLLLPAVLSGTKAIIQATPMARQALPCVHEGFLQNYSNIRNEIIAAISTVLKRQLDKAVDRCRRGGSGNDAAQPLTLPKIYVTGHSLGGAIAQLLALDLASNFEIVIEQSVSEGKHPMTNGSGVPSVETEESSDTGDVYWLGQSLSHRCTPTKKIYLRPPIAVYTYGQPRLGNSAFKTIYKRRVPHTFRVATEDDAITSLPTIGPFCGGLYRHAGLEVLLEKGCTGNILVGPTVVETLFRFTKVRTSMAAHSMDRYRESLESALGREELKTYYRGRGGKVRHDNQGYSGNGASLPSWVLRH